MPDRRRRWILLGGVAIAAGAGATTLIPRHGLTLPDSLVLATGPPGAVFLVVGQDLAAAIRARAPRTKAVVKSTSASGQNLLLLSLGQADLGFSAIDVAEHNGSVASGRIKGIARLYDSYVHLVVPASSPIEVLADLQGRRVAVGGRGSGTEYTGTTLMRAVGITTRATLRLSQTPAMQAIAKRTVDAAFSVTGLPTPAVQTLAAQTPIRLIPLGEYYPRLNIETPWAYTSATIPAGTYHGVPDTSTVVVGNALLTRPGLSDDVVRMVTETVLSNGSRKYWKHEESKQISLKLAPAMGTLQMHPAARAWIDSH